MEISKRSGSTSYLWGYIIVSGAAFTFVTSVYTMFLSKILGYFDPLDANLSINSTNISLLYQLEQDVYYCYLIPLLIPVTILAIYTNWVSLKFYRHN